MRFPVALLAQAAFTPSDGATMLSKATLELAAGENRRAAEDYRSYLAINPLDAQMWLQLAWLDSELGNRSQAGTDIERYLSLAPEEPAAKAPHYQRVSVSGYFQHDNRFSDTFYGLESSYDLAVKKLTPYIVVHYTADTRGGAAGISKIFSDNATVVNFAFRAGLGPHGVAFAEAGHGFGLRGSPSASDFRAGLAYFNEFGSNKTGHTSANASLVEYSRFGGNTILYGSLAHDFPVIGQLRGVVGSNVGADAHRDYFNNFGELFGGFQYSSRGVTLRYIRLYGTYMNRGFERPDPIDYSSTRPELLFGFAF